MWPVLSPAECFVDRRQRFLDRHPADCVLGSGVARVRNFEANRHPFRAESHFLYFVGRHIEEALLSFSQGQATLFVEPEDAEDALWHGPTPSLSKLSDELQIEVRPMAEFEVPAGVATLPSADVESSAWLEEMLRRPVEPAQFDALAQDVDLARVMIELRLHHDAYAVAQLRQAAEVTAAAHAAGMRATRPELREAFVRAQLEAEFCAAGMVPAYNTILTTHGEVLHHPSSTQLMHSGELLLVDAGAETPEGWAADVTRTWPVSGKFEGLQRDLYDAVLSTQRAAIDACKPTVRFLEVHRTAARQLTSELVDIGLLRGDVDSLLERGAAALFFPHGIGHLLGLDVHDMEDLGDLAGYGPGRQRSDAAAERFLRLDRDLAAGMLVTIEPGFYCIDGLLEGPDFEQLRSCVNEDLLARLGDIRGIRIEDDVLITEDGNEVLTQSIVKRRADVEARVGSVDVVGAA